MNFKLSTFGLLLSFLITQNLFSQDQGFNYQAVARDNNGDVLPNSNVNLRFQIVSGTPDGPIEYQETFSSSTNAFGLLNLVIGEGSSEIGDFSSIDWSTGMYYLIVEMNGTKIDTSRFESVPFSKIATEMTLNNLEDVNSLSPGDQQVLTWDGTEWNPADLPSDVWSTNGDNIYFNSGNIGIDNDNPSSTLTIGAGPALTINGNEGDLFFWDESASITFPELSGSSNNAMIYLFNDGTQNEDRMVLAHSRAWNSYGLRYSDLQDAITWIGDNEPAMYLRLWGSQEVGFGTDQPEARMHILSDNSSFLTAQLIEQTSSSSLNDDHQIGSDIYVENTNQSNDHSTFGIFLESINEGGGAAGIWSYAYTKAGGSNQAIGVRAWARNDNGSGVSYGVYSSISASSTSTGTQYAGYFNGDLYATGSYLPSDKKLKAGLSPSGSVLDKVLSLEVDNYSYRKKDYSTMKLPAGKRVGFTAQNVKEFMPELVKEAVQPATTEEEIKAGMQPSEEIRFEVVDYIGMIPYLVKSVQEQQEIIQEQQKMIELKDSQLDNFRSRLSELEQRLSRLELQSLNR